MLVKTQQCTNDETGNDEKESTMSAGFEGESTDSGRFNKAMGSQCRLEVCKSKSASEAD